VSFICSVARTVDTSQTYLDISNNSDDAADDYFVDVTAHVGQEKSESASIRFTYSKDYYDEKTHKYKCMKWSLLFHTNAFLCLKNLSCSSSANAAYVRKKALGPQMI